ncbi:MAG: hypothetical protein M1827_006837 [Pycnora praestabilis]|nr:MAG: hypothetical protein M1827_006837 [Pycnora praestabilis]
MEFARNEYPGMLGSLQPGEAVAALNDRVKRVGKINTEIADWLQERRRVEEVYVQSLKRLAQKQPPDESSELGVFATPWQRIVSSTDSLAQSHSILAQKIEMDVERPLRDFGTKNREMQAISTMQGNLAAMAKEIESAQKKSDKLKDKGGKAAAGKVATATSDVESATSQWESQAPFVFEKLQAVDESRLNHLRDVLTQFQTHEVDQVERNRVTAEDCLNALLNVETADEIFTFAARTTGRGGRRPHGERQRSSRMPATNNQPPVTPNRAVDDAVSQRSAMSGGAARSGSTQERSNSGLSGLKRLGTVIGRRKSTAPYGRASSPEKRSTTGFRPFGGRADSSSKDIPRLPSPEVASSKVTATTPTQDRLPMQERPQTQDRPSTQRNDTQPTLNETRGIQETTNGDTIAPVPAEPFASPNAANGFGGSGTSQLQEPIQPQPRAPTDEGQRDAEGFTIPPSGTDAISQAQQEAASENVPPQFKLDIRNDPIQEEDSDAATALASVANTLRAQAAPNRKLGTTRGRRDVRNTIFVPSPQSPELSTSDSPIPPPSPFRSGSRAATLSAEEQMGSDTQSIRSSRSMGSLASATIKHPEMHQPGLNSSIVETVSAWFEHGRVTKAVVIGELALAYNPADLSASFGTESVRLDNFPVLEKVAPNPTFISQTPEKSGEYSVHLSNVTRTTVAFKYQVHLEETGLATHAPIVLTPAWKVEPNQASVILTYALNPLLTASAKRSVTLQNVILIINLEGVKPLSCQSKPVGTFLKDKSAIYWRLGDLTLEIDSAPQKLLARFTTETEAKPGNVEARWEITGEDATGLGSGLSISQLSTSSEAHAGGSDGADPFADEGAASSPSIAWKEVPIVRRLNSGKYIAV